MANKDLEADVYQRLRRAIYGGMHIERIENAAKSGIFDLALSRRSRTIWIELKRDTKKSLRVSQLNWALGRYAVGCTRDMFVIAPHPDRGWCVFDTLSVLQNNGDLAQSRIAHNFEEGSELRLFILETFNGI